RARCCLDLLLEIWRDVARAKAGIDPADLAHGDNIEPFLAYSDTGRAHALQVCLQVRQDVSLNLGAETLLDRALLGAAPAPKPRKR
ncbi:MAG: hypothetical protein P1V35_17855, partial [Planctomycetota bacterium]|nr:hypothetical protein [Planctomycetota bacterium]